jgi:hypothetical protein
MLTQKTRPQNLAAMEQSTKTPDNENPRFPPATINDARTQLLILSAKEVSLKSEILKHPREYHLYYSLTTAYNICRRKRKQILNYAKAQNWF